MAVRKVTALKPLRVMLASATGTTQVSMRARPANCAAATPLQLMVRVDGRRVGRATFKSSTRWHTVAVSQVLGAGSHTLRLDLNGAPACAKVLIDQLRLDGGSAAPPDTISPLGPKRKIPLAAAVNWDIALGLDRPEQQAFLGHFQGLTPENAMKMTYVEPRQGDFDWSETDPLMDFAGREGRSVRGHALIWHKQLPGWLTSRRWTRDQIAGVMQQWIGTIVSRYKGRITDWDVLNELFDDNGAWRTNSVWYASMGAGLAEAALTMAHRADPGAKLYINDYDIEEPGPKQDAVYNLARDLKAAGVPLDGIGFQSHWSGGDDLPSEPVVRASLQRFAALGLRVELTELDITTDHSAGALDRQAQAYAMAGRVCQSVASCDRVTVWGLSDRDSWRGPAGRPLLFDDGFQEKPAYAALVGALRAG